MYLDIIETRREELQEVIATAEEQLEVIDDIGSAITDVIYEASNRLEEAKENIFGDATDNIVMLLDDVDIDVDTFDLGIEVAAEIMG